MSAVPVTIKGTLSEQGSDEGKEVVLMGLLNITGLGVGGGPVIPVTPPNPPHPEFPIWGPPGTNFPDKPGYPPVASHPIVIPPIIPPPDEKPPIDVPPGTVVVPPWDQPVQPIVPPQYIIVFYPGVGWVFIGKPEQGDASPKK